MGERRSMLVITQNERSLAARADVRPLPLPPGPSWVAAACLSLGLWAGIIGSGLFMIHRL